MATEPSDEQVAEVVALAIQAAGPQPNAAAWTQRVGEMIPVVAMALLDGSPQRQRASAILSSRRVFGEYQGYAYEASSTRCVVTYHTRPTKYAKDGIETVRTERTDTAVGRAQRAKLDAIAPGSRTLWWIYLDRTGNLETGEGVRTLAHFEPLDSGASPPPDRPAGDSPSPAGPPPDGPPAGRPAATSPHAERVASACEGLTSRQLGTVAGICREKGIINWRQPGDLEIERVLETIRNVKDAF